MDSGLLATDLKVGDRIRCVVDTLRFSMGQTFKVTRCTGVQVTINALDRKGQPVVLGGNGLRDFVKVAR